MALPPRGFLVAPSALALHGSSGAVQLATFGRNGDSNQPFCLIIFTSLYGKIHLHGSAMSAFELELERTQTHSTHKPKLRVEVSALIFPQYP